MLKTYSFFILLLTNVACSADVSTNKTNPETTNAQKVIKKQEETKLASTDTACAISSASISIPTAIDLGSVKSVAEKTFKDISSNENVIEHTVVFTNGDEAILNQKYCSMYNFTADYKIKSINKNSFQAALDNIQKLTEAVKQDFKLKAPLKLFVDMEMNKNNYSLDQSFEFSLSDKAIKSGEYVETNILFEKPESSANHEARIEFYFGLGGQ